jgi:acyl-CoA reductase-like NAD-dependent aldehyde dehydrogenase
VSGDAVPSFDPSSGEAVGVFTPIDATGLAAAISAARASFDAGLWARSPRLRASVLLDFATRLERAKAEVSALLSAENGKLQHDAEHEVAAGISELRYYAGLARNVFGRVTEVEPGLLAMLAREPLGVAAIIVPWNAPVTLLVRSLAPALAAGCTVVIKGHPEAALVTTRVVELLAEDSRLPKGAINLIHEIGSEQAQALVASPLVDVVSYTGSTAVGKRIMAAGAATMKRLNLELGGSAPCIVLPDADLDAAAAGIARAGLSHTGQVCVAASRVLVHADVAKTLMEKLVERLRGAIVGSPRDHHTQMGPLINRAARDRILALGHQAAESGKVLLEPRVPDGLPAAGHYVTAGLVEISDLQSPLLNDEVFGPLLSVSSVANDEEALARANHSRFGLAASVWTEDLKAGQRIAGRVQAGTVWINQHLRMHAEIETGGYKESGLGRLHGIEGLEAFLQTKHISWTVN